MSKNSNTHNTMKLAKTWKWAALKRALEYEQRLGEREDVGVMARRFGSASETIIQAAEQMGLRHCLRDKHDNAREWEQLRDGLCRSRSVGDAALGRPGLTFFPGSSTTTEASG